MSDSLKKWLPLAILGGAGVIAAAVVFLGPSPETRAAPEVLPIVSTVVVEPQSVTLAVEAQGTVEPEIDTTIVAQVAGEIVRTGSRFADGSLVNEGEILAVIDPRDYQLGVTRAEVALAQARLALELEQARGQVAREEWVELGKGEPPPLAAREPQIAEAQAAVDAAQAALEQAQLNLDRTRIRAPFRGRVRAKLADRGQYVAPGTPLARVIAVDRAEIPLPVAQRDLTFLPADATSADTLSIPVLLTLDGQREWTAEVVRSSGEFDPRTRMMTLTAVMDDPLALQRDGEPLPFGAFVAGSIRGREVDNVVILPRAALRQDDRVLVLEDGNQLRFRTIEVLRTEPDRVLVSSGLERGERVSVSPLEAPVDGMRVEVDGSTDAESDPDDDTNSGEEVRP